MQCRKILTRPAPVLRKSYRSVPFRMILRWRSVRNLARKAFDLRIRHAGATLRKFRSYRARKPSIISLRVQAGTLLTSSLDLKISIRRPSPSRRKENRTSTLSRTWDGNTEKDNRAPATNTKSKMPHLTKRPLTPVTIPRVPRGLVPG